LIFRGERKRIAPSREPLGAPASRAELLPPQWARHVSQRQIDVSRARTYIRFVMFNSVRTYRFLLFAGSLLAGT
jgi:hypothetical protein